MYLGISENEQLGTRRASGIENTLLTILVQEMNFNISVEFFSRRKKGSLLSFAARSLCGGEDGVNRQFVTLVICAIHDMLQLVLVIYILTP